MGYRALNGRGGLPHSGTTSGTYQVPSREGRPFRVVALHGAQTPDEYPTLAEVAAILKMNEQRILNEQRIGNWIEAGRSEQST